MIYKIGMIGPEINHLQTVLVGQGFDPGPISGIFTPATQAAVIQFQQRHLDDEGRWLAPDGEVGPRTWWALEHPSGVAQKSNLGAVAKNAGMDLIPKGLTPKRHALCAFEVGLWEANVHEVPDGSNGGDGVDRINGGRHDQWCMETQQFALEEVLHFNPFGQRGASCYYTMMTAKRLGFWRPLNSAYIAIPGDIFVMLHDLGGGYSPGHTGMKLRGSENGAVFNTIAGNEGNRIKLGLRWISQKGLAGWINVFGPEEQPVAWERGVVVAQAVAAERTT